MTTKTVGIRCKRGVNMEGRTKKIVLAALFAALACVATMIIKVPSPLKGYLNLGDCIVLLCGWILGPFYGFIAAGIGSGLADLFSGYITYAPATVVIKGLMAVAAYWIFASLGKRNVNSAVSRILSGIVAEIIMVGGYYLFEGFLYGFGASIVNIPANVIQGAAGIITGVILAGIFEKQKVVF